MPITVINFSFISPDTVRELVIDGPFQPSPKLKAERKTPRAGNPITFIAWGGDRPCGGFGFFYCNKCHALFNNEGILVTDFPLESIPVVFRGSSVFDPRGEKQKKMHLC